MEDIKEPSGKLFLIPCTLGENEPLEVLPISIKRAIEEIDHYIVENEKSARRFIKKISPRKQQPNLQIEVLNKYTEPETIPTFLQPCIEGHNVGVISEAGCPGIADPGAECSKIGPSKRCTSGTTCWSFINSIGFNGQRIKRTEFYL